MMLSGPVRWGVPILACALPLSLTGVRRDAVSAPITDVRYEVRFDRATAAMGVLEVHMRFRVESAEPVLLSLPAWTPGSYGLENFARRVSEFAAGFPHSQAAHVGGSIISQKIAQPLTDWHLQDLIHRIGLQSPDQVNSLRRQEPHTV